MSFKFKHGGSEAASTQGEEAINVITSFNYLFPDLANDPASTLDSSDSAKMIGDLEKLAAAMAEDSDTEESNSTIPAIYTYWGQFIDHDITATLNTLGIDITAPDFTPAPPNDVATRVFNQRRPELDLDSVYGDGPEAGAEAADFYEADGVRFKIGTNSNIGDPLTPVGSDLNQDLPRPNQPTDKSARIGDGRNDENTIVSQFHLAWLHFHNRMVDWVESQEGLSGSELFWRANQLVRFHYQWLVVSDFLKNITMPGTVDRILYGGKQLFMPDADSVFMPVEFAMATYRYGHSMVRGNYDFNKNFGRDDDGSDSGNRASFGLLFAFTAAGDFFGQPTLPNNWIIQWERFISHTTSLEDRYARKIDTNIAFALSNMTTNAPPAGSVDDRARGIMLHLSKRNLLRGYLMSVPTGQAIADAMGEVPLSEAEIKAGVSAEMIAALDAGNFATKTPLWFYILKEAEVRGSGNCLGPVGSRIVAETMLGLLHADANSYMHHGWDPSKGARLISGAPIVTIQDMLQFAGFTSVIGA